MSQRRIIDHYVIEIAEVYEAAVARGDHPRLAVMEHFEVAKWTASKYIARARSSGWLAPYVSTRRRRS
jgi:hypothetical protein